MPRFIDMQPINCKINLHPFLLGIARLFDFAQVLNMPGNKLSSEVDSLAMKNDWIALGKDMRITFDKFAHEYPCE